MSWKSEKHRIFVLLIFMFSQVEIYAHDEKQGFLLDISQNQSGFHRTVCYNAVIQNMNGSSSILIKENLPKDMYVDPYQVSEKDGVLIKEFVDCEIPAFLAHSLEVSLCSLSKTNIHNICIPIHIRYQAPHQCEVHGKSVLINMITPEVSVRNIRDYSHTLSVGCFAFMESAIFYVNSDVQPLSFRIPVGCTEHFFYVLFLTVLVISLSVIYLTFLLLNVDFDISKRLG